MSAPEDYGARVIAARHFARLTQDGLAQATGLGRKVVLNIEKNEHTLTVPEARQIAATCRVPVSFIIEGWVPSVLERLSTIQAEVDQIEDKLETLRDMLTLLAAGEAIDVSRQAIQQSRERLAANGNPPVAA